MKTKICLCMIVKNETEIITETLDGIMKQVNDGGVNLTYWVICDTGSTDGTQKLIIDYFKKKGIKGELKEHKWKDFGHNRTLAFNECENGNAKKHSNYIWIIDADDVPRGNFKIPKKLNKDRYNLTYISGLMKYYRPQIFKIGLGWKYYCVLHEYAEPTFKDKASNGFIDGDYYIHSRRLGDRSLNPLKYYKDGIAIKKDYERVLKEIVDLSEDDDLKVLYEKKKILEGGEDRLKMLIKKIVETSSGDEAEKIKDEIGQHIETIKGYDIDKINKEIQTKQIFIKSNKNIKRIGRLRYIASRYTFYMGQSFRDFGDYEYSRKWYKYRGDNPIRRYDEEAFQARLEVAKIDISNDAEKVESLFLYAHDIYPFTAEPFYFMAEHFNDVGDYERAYKWGKKAYSIKFPSKTEMFLRKDVYEYNAAKVYGYAAHKLGMYEESYNVLEDTLSNKTISIEDIIYIENIRNMNDVNKLLEIKSRCCEKPIKKEKTQNVTVLFKNVDERCINSFLNCCKDVDVVEKFVMNGYDEKPDFLKSYPFIEYIQSENFVPNTEYTLYINGSWGFIYDTCYIDPYIKFMKENREIQQIQLTFCSGENLRNGYNKRNVSYEVPSIFKTMTVKQDSQALSRRMFSCIKIK